MKNHEFSPQDPNQEQAREQVAETHETDGDMNFSEALNYLQQEYAQTEDAEYGEGSRDRQSNQVLLETINRARNGEPAAYDQIMQFVAQEKDRLTGNQNSEEGLKKVENLERVQVAVEVQKQRDIDNSSNEKMQQFKIAEVRAQQNDAANNARNEIYKIYPLNSEDFQKEAAEAAGKFGTNWQALTSNVDFDQLVQSNEDKAAAALLMLKNLNNSPNNSRKALSDFQSDWANLMSNATDNNRSVPNAVSTEPKSAEATKAA